MNSAETHTQPYILVRDVSHSYRNGATTVAALANITVEWVEPTFVCMLGPSGCGKTTLLRVLAGLLEPSEGSVAVLGRKPQELHSQGRVSYLSQEPHLLPWRTVRENILLPTSYQSQTEREHFQLAKLLPTLELEAFADTYPPQLSGGMKTRVALARAWITRPEILLLDEPFGALDPDTALTIGLELRRTRAELSAMVVMITHSAEQAALLADDVVIMSSRPARILNSMSSPLSGQRTMDAALTPQYFDFLGRIRNLQRPSP